jgi:hypothetical protein
MKRVFLTLALCVIACAMLGAGTVSAKMFSFGCHRDAGFLAKSCPAPCIFPPVSNPCAVPCRPPGIQYQSVPCAYKTACPSGKLPCYGYSYGANPYPLFR